MQLSLMLPKLLYELKIPCSKKSSKFPLQLEKMLYRQQIWRMAQLGFSGLQFNSKQTQKKKVPWLEYPEKLQDDAQVNANGITVQKGSLHKLRWIRCFKLLATCSLYACSCMSWPRAACPCSPCACAPCPPCACMSRPLAA